MRTVACLAAVAAAVTLAASAQSVRKEAERELARPTQPGAVQACTLVTRGDVRSMETMRPLVKDADVIIPLAALVGAPLETSDQAVATWLRRRTRRL